MRCAWQALLLARGVGARWGPSLRLTWLAFLAEESQVVAFLAARLWWCCRLIACGLRFS